MWKRTWDSNGLWVLPFHFFFLISLVSSAPQLIWSNQTSPTLSKSSLHCVPFSQNPLLFTTTWSWTMLNSIKSPSMVFASIKPPLVHLRGDQFAGSPLQGSQSYLFFFFFTAVEGNCSLRELPVPPHSSACLSCSDQEDMKETVLSQLEYCKTTMEVWVF